MHLIDMIFLSVYNHYILFLYRYRIYRLYRTKTAAHKTQFEERVLALVTEGQVQLEQTRREVEEMKAHDLTLKAQEDYRQELHMKLTVMRNNHNILTQQQQADAAYQQQLQEEIDEMKRLKFENETAEKKKRLEEYKHTKEIEMKRLEDERRVYEEEERRRVKESVEAGRERVGMRREQVAVKTKKRIDDMVCTLHYTYYNTIILCV